jgi:hypothetical protein
VDRCGGFGTAGAQKNSGSHGGFVCRYIAVAWYRVPVWRDELLLFAQALQLEPDNPSIRLRLATELIRHGRPDDAMAQLDEILKRSPSDIKTLTSKAGLQVFKKDWQGVEETCAKTLQLEASTAVCHLTWGLRH